MGPVQLPRNAELVGECVFMPKVWGRKVYRRRLYYRGKVVTVH
jgi:hypothetical protein